MAGEKKSTSILPQTRNALLRLQCSGLKADCETREDSLLLPKLLQSFSCIHPRAGDSAGALHICKLPFQRNACLLHLHSPIGQGRQVALAGSVSELLLPASVESNFQQWAETLKEGVC